MNESEQELRQKLLREKCRNDDLERGWSNCSRTCAQLQDERDEAAARIRALTDENSKLFQSNMGFAERIERLQSDLAAAERSRDRHRADAEGCVWRVKNSQLG